MRLRVAVLALIAAGCGNSEGLADEDELATVSSELRTNDNPNRIVVYSNNLENMIFDWKDLVHVMGESELRPDIFLVQQVTSKNELERLMQFMKQRLGVDYDGVVAQNHPNDHRFDGQLIPRPTVTTGVIYRKARFNLDGHNTWMPFGTGFKDQKQSCDDRSNHSGYETIRVKLFDKVAKKNVVAVSLRHWTWEPCSGKNVREIDDRLGDSAALQIVGGDFNDGLFDGSGAYACWYKQVNRSIGEASCPGNASFDFTDPLFAECKGDKPCVRNRGGIDSLFVRRADGKAAKTDHFDIVSFDQAHHASVKSTGGDGPSNLKSRDGYNDQADRYSGHEARRAWVYYE